MQMIERNISTPIYVQVKGKMFEFIKENSILAGQKLPTEVQFAKKYKVSHSTIRKAMAELEQEEIISRSRRKGTFLTTKAQSILSVALDKNKTFTVYIDMSAAGFYERLVGAIEKEVLRTGYILDIRNIYSKGQFDTDKYSKIFEDNIPRAAIMVPLSDEPDDIYFQLERRNIPFAIIDKNVKGLDNLKADFVGLDNFKGGYIAVKYLIESGHRKIACITNLNISPGIDRLAGYRKALEDNNIKFDESLVISEKDSRIIIEDYSERARELLAKEKDITAVFAWSDYAANDVYKACKELGKSIPEDISVTGFDNNPFTRLMDVPLTTVEQPMEELARISVGLLIEKISGASNYIKHIVIKPKLIIRKSVSKAKQIH